MLEFSCSCIHERMIAISNGQWAQSWLKTAADLSKLALGEPLTIFDPVLFHFEGLYGGANRLSLPASPIQISFLHVSCIIMTFFCLTH
jgi:hypothetical protein